MISVSSRHALALLVVNGIISLFSSAHTLRTSKRMRTPSAQECTIVVRSDLRLDDVDSDTFECILDPSDANGIEGMSVPIRVTDEQSEVMKQRLANGELVSNVSTLTMNAGFKVSDEGVLVPIDMENFEFGTREGENGRRLATVTGLKPILVVKVRDSEGRARSESLSQISDDIFGSFEDSMTLKSQMSACSFGQLQITPGLPDGSDTSVESPGVIDITIGASLSNDRGTIRNAIKTAVEGQLGHTLPGPYQHVMYVLEGCYQDCGWAAYAAVNSWLSVYQGVHYKFVGVQMHELGHNFNLAHSGGLDGKIYTDHTGMMGNPLYEDNIGAMCWNAAKTWQIGWYDSNKQMIKPRQGEWSGTTIVGIADFNNNPSNYPVVVKIETGFETDQFIAFNRASGINRHNDEADNEVTVVETGKNGEGYAQSYLKAHLAQGEIHTFVNWADTGQNLIIKANKINTNTGNSAGYAEVQVCLGTCANPTTHTCGDSIQQFEVTQTNGKKRMRTCEWVKRRATPWRCAKVKGAKENCPKTCNNCCRDTTESFLLKTGKAGNCDWAAVNTATRCKKVLTRMQCAVTCGECF